jgi:hypothetical protein
MDEASKRSVVLLSALAYVAVASAPAVTAIVLLVTAETWRGHLYAIAGLSLLGLPALLLRAMLRKRHAALLA